MKLFEHYLTLLDRDIATLEKQLQTLSKIKALLTAETIKKTTFNFEEDTLLKALIDNSIPKSTTIKQSTKTTKKFCECGHALHGAEGCTHQLDEFSRCNCSKVFNHTSS